MTIKEQFGKIKENWLFFVLGILLIIILFGGLIVLTTENSSFQNSMSKSSNYEASYARDSYGGGYIGYSSGYYPSPSSSFAPEVKDRKVTKTSSLSLEVERGTFRDSEAKMRSIVGSSDSFLLNDYSNSVDVKGTKYYNGNYQIKVPTSKYNVVLSQLKEIGTVKSFNEQSDDVTGTYTDLSIELAAEKERLVRYEAMYKDASDVKDKIELNDRIFNQQRTISYYENSLKNVDNQVQYSTISLSISEKRSEYVDIALVKLSSMVLIFVGSFNALVVIIVAVLPWIIGIAIVTGIVVIIRKIRRKDKTN